MTNYEQFQNQEIPYEILEKFGLTQEMIEDLPTSVMKRLLSGRTTPVLPVTMVNVEGETTHAYARISLIRLPDGTTDICFIPRLEDENLDDFTPEQQERMKLDQVAVANIPGKGECYIQYDEEVKQVMAVPAEIIKQNISILAKSFGFPDEETNDIENGSIIEFQNNGNTFSAGIDLNVQNGIRITKGNAREWLEDIKADKMPKYSFGIFGCWMQDGNNNLKYVKEDDYTEEMYKEMNRVGGQNAAQAQLKQIKI